MIPVSVPTQMMLSVKQQSGWTMHSSLLLRSKSVLNLKEKMIMNPSIRKEIEDSANPTCNRTVTRAPDGTWGIVTDHPSLGTIGYDGGYDTHAEAELVLESMSIVEEGSDIDLEIELGSDVFDEETDSEWLANNRDVPSRVELDPVWEQGICSGGLPLMRLVKVES